MKSLQRLNFSLTHLASLVFWVCLILLIPSGQHSARAAPLSGPHAQGNGCITGYVYETDGVTPIEGADVYADEFDTGQWGHGTTTQADGGYTITGLPSGDYRVSCSGQHHVHEYYKETEQHHLATPVTVVEPDTTSNIDFTLDPAGTVTGRVTEEGGAPIENLHITAIRVSDETWFGGPNTDASGYYTFTGIPATDVYIFACSGCNDHPYIEEYYDDALTKEDAAILSISAGVTTTNVDFALAMGGTLSGHVYAADDMTPIADAHVHLDNWDIEHWGRGTNTGADGSYTFKRLPSGDYRVRADAYDYLEEYYQDASRWEWADRVTVTAPSTTSGIDFTLEQGDAFIEGHVRYKDGTPVPDIEVHAGRWNGSGWTKARTDANGAYTLTVSAGTWALEADRWDSRADGHTLASILLIAIGSGETVNDVDIALWPNDATVVGVVREQDETPIPYAQVVLKDETTGWHLAHQCLARRLLQSVRPTSHCRQWRDGQQRPLPQRAQL